MEPSTVVRVSSRGVLNTPCLRLPGSCEACITYHTPSGWRLAHRTGLPSLAIKQPVEDVLLRVSCARNGLVRGAPAAAVLRAAGLQQGAMVPLMKRGRRGGYVVVRSVCSRFGLTEIVLDVFVYASCGKEEMALVMKESPSLGIEAEELVKVGRRGMRVERGGVGLMSFVRWLRRGDTIRQEAALNVLGSVNAPPQRQGLFIRNS